MTDCQHWYDPEIVELDRQEQQNRFYRLQLRIVQLEDRLRSIRALTEDPQAFANSQIRGLFGSLTI